MFAELFQEKLLPDLKAFAESPFSPHKSEWEPQEKCHGSRKKNPLNSPSMHIELKGKKSPLVVSPHILSIQLTTKSIFKLLFCHKTNLSAPDININSSSISRTTIKVNRLQLHCFPLSRQKKNGNSCLLERCSLHTLLN